MENRYLIRALKMMTQTLLFFIVLPKPSPAGVFANLNRLLTRLKSKLN